jgi:hypothetical protein
MYKNILKVCKIFNEVQGKKYHFGDKCIFENNIKILLKYKERLDPIFSLLRTWYISDLLWLH